MFHHVTFTLVNLWKTTDVNVRKFYCFEERLIKLLTEAKLEVVTLCNGLHLKCMENVHKQILDLSVFLAKFPCTLQTNLELPQTMHIL